MHASRWLMSTTETHALGAKAPYHISTHAHCRLTHALRTGNFFLSPQCLLYSTHPLHSIVRRTSRRTVRLTDRRTSRRTTLVTTSSSSSSSLRVHMPLVSLTSSQPPSASGSTQSHTRDPQPAAIAAHSIPSPLPPPAEFMAGSEGASGRARATHSEAPRGVDQPPPTTHTGLPTY
jgi:hypothetical protein